MIFPGQTGRERCGEPALAGDSKTAATGFDSPGRHSKQMEDTMNGWDCDECGRTSYWCRCVRPVVAAEREPFTLAEVRAEEALDAYMAGDPYA